MPPKCKIINLLEVVCDQKRKVDDDLEGAGSINRTQIGLDVVECIN